VLRLLPETVSAGLFPGQSWLQRRGVAPVSAETASGSAADWLDALDAMLGSQLTVPARFSSLQVVVSDSLGLMAHLPWQEELRGPGELQAYAQACFARQGVEPAADWIVQADYRRFRSAGLAYALPQDLLHQLVALAQRHRLRLRSVLPASALAYWRYRAPHKGGSLALLAETGRLTAHVYEGRRLVGVDVQPLVVDPDRAGARLLRRVTACHPGIAQVQYWQSAARVAAGAPAFVTSGVAEAAVRCVDRQWEGV